MTTDRPDLDTPKKVLEAALELAEDHVGVQRAIRALAARIPPEPAQAHAADTASVCDHINACDYCKAAVAALTEPAPSHSELRETVGRVRAYAERLTNPTRADVRAVCDAALSSPKEGTK